MCGIAGMCVKDVDNLSENRLRAIGELQQHRGPDNMGILLVDRCGFVHNRLSLIDLTSAGNQPMVLGEYVLVYNGELYNFLPLRDELERKGRQFIGRSDTEVLLHALIVYGVETTLKCIQGMFAFSFYNGGSQMLYLCRDRYGIKPLHYTVRDGDLVWASEIKAIGQVKPLQIDPIQALYSVAGNAEFHHETTLFLGVKSVAPGTFLQMRVDQDADPQSVRYYEMNDDFDPAYYRELDGMSMETAAQEFDRLMSDSVRRMLIADAPMGIFLSGGIDSSLLGALAIRHTRDLTLFTSNILGRLSEFPDAQAIGKFLDLPLYDSPFAPGDFLKHWTACTYHYEAPIVRHVSAMPMSQVARLAHQHQVKAVLTGEGSDELFLGYPHLLMQRYENLVRTPLRLVEKAYGIIPGLRRYIIPNESEQVDGFLNLLVQGYERQRFRDQARGHFAFMNEADFKRHYLSIQSMKEGIVSLLMRNDRMGMMSSIEARFPFLDEAVVRFGVNLPDKFKIGHSSRMHNIMHPFLIDKAIVRKTCEPILPKWLPHKKKLGFPMHAHRDLTIAPGFFRDGYAAQLLQMNESSEAYMLGTQNRYFVAKLAALEIFGRLYALGESQSAITDRIYSHIAIVPK